MTRRCTRAYRVPFSKRTVENAVVELVHDAKSMELIEAEASLPVCLFEDVTSHKEPSPNIPQGRFVIRSIEVAYGEACVEVVAAKIRPKFPVLETVTRSGVAHSGVGLTMVD